MKYIISLKKGIYVVIKIVGEVLDTITSKQVGDLFINEIHQKGGTEANEAISYIFVPTTSERLFVSIGIHREGNALYAVLNLNYGYNDRV